MRKSLFLICLLSLLVLSSVVLANDCSRYPTMLETCTPFSCSYQHPMTGDMVSKSIIGEKAGKCLTTEQMPDAGQANCAFNVEFRKAVSQYLKLVDGGHKVKSSTTFDTATGKARTTETVDGLPVVNPLQEAFDKGICQVSGYN
ncbi:MAG: hypothetical protein WC612_06955 [Bdellovibrionales bacterium]|jgi:hypothetical protein